MMTPVSACSSGSEAIARAWQQIVLGEADIAICGGVETKIEAVPIAGFAQMRIVLSTNNDDPAGACRPFDKDRDGFVFGEAGALLVIETEEHAKARGANILARLMGAAVTSDGYHIVAPDPNGERAGHAMTRAIQLADLTPGDIDHVNAHATGTSVGDVAEGKAINNALGPMAETPRSTPPSRRWPFGRCGRRGGVDPDRARVAGPDHPAHTEPGQSRPGDRPRRGGGQAAAGQLQLRDQQLVRIRRAQRRNRVWSLLSRTPIEEETCDDDHGPRRGWRIT
ncbi:3-oxoacyl-[acyl-carrier-protein] synthase 2 [Mycobacterium xenopi 4042]|uniref:3-oxoacyl-[acyl-carrier-protein] synthase 2 n=1 Tax=Mycobacterium xenopi 4042 TaxID=1299334 RepID=X8DB36_MYCXE|nr:3-oxoacyl-[acyl-carrier-protein] synthase 2 [Mycobacterium xenopi 4042]